MIAIQKAAAQIGVAEVTLRRWERHHNPEKNSGKSQKILHKNATGCYAKKKHTKNRR